MVKKSIILLAGREKKLSPLTDKTHQSLFDLNGSTILENMLTKLVELGTTEIILVVGHKADMIKNAVGNRFNKARIKYVYNKDYNKTNVIYSLWLARNEFNDGFILIDGDLICEKALLEKLIRSKNHNEIVVDYIQKLSKDDVIAKIVKNRVAAIGKYLNVSNDATFGRAIGISKFSKTASRMLLKYMRGFINKGKINSYYEDALNMMLDKVDFVPLDVRGFNWIEVDKTEEFEKAKKIFSDIIELKEKALEYGADEAFTILPRDLLFDDRALLKCFNCSKYNSKWTCPPKCPMINYKELMMKYREGILVVVKMNFDENDFEKVRKESSNKLHKILLRIEKDGFNRENHYTLSFIGGSCKLCNNECGKNKCKNPQAARVPLEATGVDIVKTLDKYGYKLKFPVRDQLCRVGLLLVG